VIIISGANEKIRLVTGSGGANIEWHASWVENNAGTLTPKDSGTSSAVTSATNTDVIAAIGASKQGAVKELSAKNTHASASDTVKFQAYDGTNTANYPGVTLLAGESLICDELGNWTHYDSNGGAYPAVGNIAVQSDLEAGTSNTLVVTPGRMQYHPGTNKFWGLFSISGTTTAGYNVDAPTDNGTGDITVNITTDMSSSSWCGSVAVEMTATTYAVANARTPHIRFGGQAAGTLRCDCIDGTTITQLVKDPTVWHISGLGDQA